MLPSTLEAEVKLILGTQGNGSSAFFGPGLIDLCKGVRDTGSLNAAAKGMSMAYSKAWRLVKSAEDDLGCELLNRNGAHGSTLTADAERLISIYDALSEQLRQNARAALKKMIETECE